MCDRHNNGALFAGLGYSPEQRERLFYHICLPVRVLLLVIIMSVSLTHLTKYSGGAVAGYILLVLGFITMVYNIQILSQKSCRWWDPKSSVVLGAVMAGVGGAVASGNMSPGVGGLVVASFGLGHAAHGAMTARDSYPWV